tara:strand:- start:236 stop:883 length:648 start_codon:yes stop_codon:yes gene_type:complete
MKKFLTLLVLIFFFTNVYGDNIEIFQFTDKELDTLKVRKIRGAKNLTNYSLGNNDKGNFLRSEVKNGGSGLGKEVYVDLNKTPFLNITWKVEKDLSGINEKSKKGHDFAARFFVVKKTGLTPLSNKAINYVFSSNEEIGDFWSSPYTKSSIDYVLSSTKYNLNEWVTVKTNVKEDYKKLHNLEINILDGVAIMADSDQSKNQSISYFQNIYFSAN